MATCSRVLAWKIPWTEEPGRLQSMESPRVGQDWATEHTHVQLRSLRWACVKETRFKSPSWVRYSRFRKPDTRTPLGFSEIILIKNYAHFRVLKKALGILLLMLLESLTGVQMRTKLLLLNEHPPNCVFFKKLLMNVVWKAFVWLIWIT